MCTIGPVSYGPPQYQKPRLADGEAPTMPSPYLSTVCAAVLRTPRVAGGRWQVYNDEQHKQQQQQNACMHTEADSIP